METVTLYTVQDPSIMKDIETKDIIIPKEPNIEHLDDKKAYNWIFQKMKEIGLCLNNETNHMFWAFTDKENCKHFEGILFELEVPVNCVFFTDYIDYHSILNNGPVCILPGNPEDWTEEDLNKEYDRLVKERLIEKSWDNCIIKYTGNGMFRSPTFGNVLAVNEKCTIQANLECIKKEWIKKHYVNQTREIVF